MTEYERGQRDLAKRIYNIIAYDRKSNELRFLTYPDYKKSTYVFNSILKRIFVLVKEKMWN